MAATVPPACRTAAAEPEAVEVAGAAPLARRIAVARPDVELVTATVPAAEYVCGPERRVADPETAGARGDRPAGLQGGRGGAQCRARDADGAGGRVGRGPETTVALPETDDVAATVPDAGLTPAAAPDIAVVAAEVPLATRMLTADPLTLATADTAPAAG